MNISCTRCHEEFLPQKGFKKYCSKQCRNGRNWSFEDKQKKSIAAKNSQKVKDAHKKNVNTLKILSKYKELGLLNKQRANQLLLATPFEDLSFERRRKRVLLEQEGRCAQCNLSTWCEKPLVLELEHKDGNHKNNLRDNLEGLCPNCHSLTPTWRGRNKNEGSKILRNNRVDFEKLLQTLIDNDWNIRQSLLKVGMAAKGANYARCYKLKKWFDENQIP